MTTDELLSEACPVVRDIGWVFYFSPETLARGESLGLDLFQFYVLGRGGVLGDVEPAVMLAAFGYFNPALIEPVWEAAAAKVRPRDAGRVFMECAADHGRAALADVDTGLLDGFNAAAEAIVAAADPTALPLFAGAAAEPRSDDAPARAMQLVAVLREFRGSAHLVALRAVGLGTRTAHFLNRPNDMAMFGWGEADVPEVNEETHRRLAEAEALTDRIVAPAYGALDDIQRDQFLSGLSAIEAALTA